MLELLVFVIFQVAVERPSGCRRSAIKFHPLTVHTIYCPRNEVITASTLIHVCTVTQDRREDGSLPRTKFLSYQDRDLQ